MKLWVVTAKVTIKCDNPIDSQVWVESNLENIRDAYNVKVTDIELLEETSDVPGE